MTDTGVLESRPEGAAVKLACGRMLNFRTEAHVLNTGSAGACTDFLGSRITEGACIYGHAQKLGVCPVSPTLSTSTKDINRHSLFSCCNDNIIVKRMLNVLFYMRTNFRPLYRIC